MTRRAASRRGTSLQALEKNEGGEGDRGVELRAVQGVSDEVGELDVRAGKSRAGTRGQAEIRESASETCYGLMPIEGAPGA